MIARLTRPVAAVFLLIGGIVHYELWQQGYRHIPNIGPLFLANFAVSLVLAAAVLGTRRLSVDVAGIVFAAGSVAALVLSRTVGIFGFSETIWTPQAVNTLASELGAILALALAVAVQIHRNHEIEQQAGRPVPAPIHARRPAASASHVPAQH